MQPPTEAPRRTPAEWVHLLGGRGEAAAAAWRELGAGLGGDPARFAEALTETLPDEERMAVLRGLLATVILSARRDWRHRRRLFDEAESLGTHFLPIHYYSPIPNTRDLRPDIWTTRWDDGLDFDWREGDQLALLDRLAAWAQEIRDTPTPRPAVEGQYHYDNGNFGPLDAAAYYGMIREFRPRHVLEVGAGYSTMIAASAALRNGTTSLRAVDPFPITPLRHGFPGLASLAVSRAQDVVMSDFEALSAGDILFIDGTHVSRMDSDVNHLILRVLPRLRPGVLIHFHDIYLPWDYPQHLLTERKRFWNEQYLVWAVLLFAGAYRVIWASYYMSRVAEDRLRRALPFLPRFGGTSLWMRREP